MRALVVAPHPDDAELAAAALLGPHATILCLTHAGDDRADEARRAAKILGADLLMADHEDGALAPVVELVETIEDAIAATDADVIAGPPLSDEHQDHRAVAAAVRSATRRSSLTVLEYETPSTPPSWEPDTFLLVTAAQATLREDALAEHRSQLDHPYTRPDVLRARLTVRGQWVGLVAAEAYRTVRRVRL